MELVPISDEIRQFLLDRFLDVRDEPPQEGYYIFSVKPHSSQLRHNLRVRKNVAVHPNGFLNYLRTHDFVGKLENSDVEIC
jgi:hypothetical protein